MKAFDAYELLRELTDALHGTMEPQEQKELLELLEADMECRQEIQQTL
jgi:hypothetical protein